MLTKILFVSFLVLLILGFLFFAGCSRGCGRHGSVDKRADWVVKKLGKKLDLTDDQKARVEKIKKDILEKRAQTGPLHEGLHGAFLAEFRKDNLNTEKLNQTMAERETKFKDVRGFWIQKISEFHAVLTPDQREKLAKKLDRWGRCGHRG